MTPVTRVDSLYEIIATRWSERGVTVDPALDGCVHVPVACLVEVARFCRDDARLTMDSLTLISGVDRPAAETIEVIYHLDSYQRPAIIVLKVTVPRAEPVVPTLCELWPSADWMERETYDMLGVIFDGHPNLRRILCAEDWEGYPLRKDYVTPAYYHGVPNIFFLEQLTPQQKELLFGDMTHEQRQLIYGE
jgi:NADH-quinone oxidoreductase subunit C